MNKRESIRTFIVENFLFGDEGDIKDNTDLFKHSIIDSTGILELIAYLEVTYNITVQDNEIIQNNFSSIDAIDKFLQEKTQAEKSRICAE